MLFKYLPEERLDVLENLKIRYSPLKSLNDPYESLPLFDVEDLINEQVTEGVQRLDELWVGTSDVEKTTENKTELDRLRDNLDHDVRKIITSAAYRDNVMELFGDTFGVLSLSRSNMSLLMWSHYSSSNSGYVIGFNEDHEFLHQKTIEGNITHPMAVQYSDKRQFVKYSDRNIREKILSHKPLEWSYEQEERIFMALMDKNKSNGHVDAFGNDVILYDIPVSAISEIYIGSRASLKTHSRIREAVQKHQINCSVFETQMSEKEYRIELVE